MIKRCILYVFCIVTGLLPVTAQVVPEGFESQELFRIVTSFQQRPFLSFNAQYSFYDSVGAVVPSEQLNGQYKIHDGRYWAMLDSTELVQGYNYNLAIYHDYKIMMIGKPSPVASGMLQLSFFDSLFNENFIDHMHVNEVSDSLRKLDVDFKDESPYTFYEVYYNPFTYLISNVTYHLKDVETGEISVVVVALSSYSEAVIDDSYFSESKFIYRDGANFYAQLLWHDYEVNVNADF